MALKEITNTNLFTKKEILEDIMENDTTFEITGYVSSIFQIKSTTRNGKTTHLFNFIMSNGEITIQIAAWNDLAFKYADIITQTEQVYSLQKVVPKIPLRKEYLHNASFPYELLIRSSTIVVPIGIYKIPKEIETISLIKMQNARTKSGLIIEMEHHIKMIFEKSSNNHFYIGAITDGYYKLSVLITCNGEFEDNFTYGSPIKVIGKMQVPENKPPYLSVSSVENVQLIDGEKMSFLQTLKGYHPIP
ncbi:uncharacterized protein LOC114937213 [Nylanderia fulva]|uniref:uncharacterized protein LOC114927861 n=2 Tax=Nylanderia fulva TaxID=613905 RepID=UPI0010FAE32F|nr:uncharacterized protein LOC114927861 [Nylanderia fulva]XP_029157960.1 uncharacterized protein LOC114930363 [Nylanderia fulva]XP_029161123.1 uncharacterized protein LOC114932877 [Nylanderia fulva]XP_029162246.1 uncharacterized protein LOC114933837 [Nylanderia fulva]XP_029162916.1 uncharacterized protein LOC114934403 [Nylanderia fulva]XP_029163666.1 uncharacterized protein LOC114935074 [Nylanderia fulva]XP_029166463.1 uncharacterized protein LOC114937213 [Nylanderia fulva]